MTLIDGRGRPEVRPSVYVKTYLRDVQDEFAKAMCLWEIGAESGYFKSPKPLRFDAGQRTIEYEFIDAVVPLTEQYLAFCASSAPAHEVVDLFERAGLTLGRIHNDLKLNGDATWHIPPRFRGALRRVGILPALAGAPSGRAYAHGDFGFSNVLAGMSPSDPLTIIDASPNEYTSVRATSFEPVYSDLALFVSCIRGRVPTIRGFLAYVGNRRATLEETFLRAYEHERLMKVDRSLLQGTVVAVFDAFRVDHRNRGWRRIHRRGGLRVLQTVESIRWGRTGR